MNKKFVLLAFASVLLSAMIGTQLIASAAAPRTVGVSEGDWALYSVTFSGNGTMPGMENITSVMITVQKISDTNITFEELVHYANDTEDTTTLILDVDTGQGNGTGMFIAADLNAGDFIYNSPDPSDMFYNMTINSTISRMYLGEIVTVNHFNLTMNQTYPGVYNMTASMNYYWYKDTGMLAEISMYQLMEQFGNTTWWEMEALIIDIIPEFPPAMILPLFMIVTLTAVWLGKTVWSTKKSIKKPSSCT